MIFVSIHAWVTLLLTVSAWNVPTINSTGAEPSDEMRSANCGQILMGLMTYCSDTRHSTVVRCCEKLRLWNKGMCWCEKNAFMAACNLSMDDYAFQFRTKTCNMTEFFHPDIQLPTSRVGKIPSTCPIFKSLPPSEMSESHCLIPSPTRLRARRLEFLQRFIQEDVERENDLASWSARIDSTLAPDARLFSIGISFHFPRRNIKQYLLWRSTLLKGPLWKSNIHMDTVFWRTSNSVSYVAHRSIGQFSFSKIEFVVFESCSPRIAEIYSLDEEAVRLYRQFVYLEPADRQLWKTQQVPEAWCVDVQRICPGNLFPFSNISSCSAFYKHKIANEQVTCARSSAERSILALHGDTLSCRSMFLDLARMESGFCRFLGRPGIGRCRGSGCLSHDYNDIFNEENPRFESSGGYSCSDQNCIEEWPVTT